MILLIWLECKHPVHPVWKSLLHHLWLVTKANRPSGGWLWLHLGPATSGKGVSVTHRMLDSICYGMLQSDKPFLRCSYFKTWPWKSKAKVLDRVKQSSRSYSRSNIVSIHIPFIPCQSDHPSLKYSYLEIWPWKSTWSKLQRPKVKRERHSKTHQFMDNFQYIPFHFVGARLH